MTRKIFEQEKERTEYHPWNYTVVTKVCEKCGDEYKTISGKAKFCELCRKVWKYKYIRKDKKDFKYREAEVWLFAEPKKRKCKSCGEYYESRRRKQNYCSKECGKNRDKRLQELTSRFENE